MRLIKRMSACILVLAISSGGMSRAAVPVRARVIVAAPRVPIIAPQSLPALMSFSLTNSGLFAPNASLHLPAPLESIATAQPALPSAPHQLILPGARIPAQAVPGLESLHTAIRLLHKDAGRRELLTKIVRSRLQKQGPSSPLSSVLADLNQLYHAASQEKAAPVRAPPAALPAEARGALRDLESELARPRPSKNNVYRQTTRLYPTEKNPLTADQQRRIAEKLLQLLPKIHRDSSYWYVELIENLGRSGSEAYSEVMRGFIRTYSGNLDSSSRFAISRRLVSAAKHPAYRIELLKALSLRLNFNAADPLLHLTLVGRLPRASFADSELIMTALGVYSAGDPALRQSIWREIVAQTFENRGRALPRLKPVGSGGLWFKGRKAEVREKMPSLAAILEDPAASGRFLSALAQLRMLSPYYQANRAFKPTLQWAKENGEVFALNELRIVPVSESFRRMLITNESGSLTLEIKFPGQWGGRMRLHKKEFLIAQWLWKKFPKDPGVVKPVYTGRLTGNIRLYGKTKDFPPEKPLVFTIFEYEDGKRLSNAGNMLSAIARRLRTTKKELLHRIRVDAAVTAFRLHQAGWLGSAKGNDMHPENIKVLRDGAGVYVADFLAFTRHRNPSLRTRQGDMRGILADYQPERDPAGSSADKYAPATDERMEAIYPDVVAKLTGGVRSRARRRRIAAEVRREFALDGAGVRTQAKS